MQLGDTLGGAVDSNDQPVYAIGIVWNDVNSDTFIDTGDNLYLRYVLGATTFAEIDTTAELNAAVIPEPSALSLMALAFGAVVLLRRRCR
jgi:hypothetical protein